MPVVRSSRFGTLKSRLKPPMQHTGDGPESSLQMAGGTRPAPVVAVRVTVSSAGFEHGAKHRPRGVTQTEGRGALGLGGSVHCYAMVPR